MSSEIVTDSLTDAWRRTRDLLLVRPRVGHWLKLGLIAMLGLSGGGGGGGGNFSFPTEFPSQEHEPSGGLERIGPQALQGMREGLQWLSDHLGGLIALMVGLAIITVILTLVIIYVRAVFRFIFVDAVAAPEEPSIGASWSRHTGVGLSLLLWYLLLGALALALVLIVLIPLIGSGVMIGSGKPLPIAVGVGSMVGLFAALAMIVVVMLLLQALTDDFLVPAMYVCRCGVWEGWRQVRHAWRGQFWNVVLFYILKLVALIAAAIAAAIIVLASLVLLIVPAISMVVIIGTIVGVMSELSGVGPWLIAPAVVAALTGGMVYAYLLRVLTLPIAVFFQAYSLSFIGKLSPALRTI